MCRLASQNFVAQMTYFKAWFERIKTGKYPGSLDLKLVRGEDATDSSSWLVAISTNFFQKRCLYFVSKGLAKTCHNLFHVLLVSCLGLVMQGR